ncbi:gamma-aminobutyric acid type B receptor subunit 2-like [Diadema setosum]|uniref:gamma-aminobutyric acid type B receptor subunit 2-like n=1 Tax=Diadema setosum TaxID=31175 RepID=UPI003B3AD18D
MGATGNSSNLRNIFIGGLFPLSQSSFVNGRVDVEAACLALNHVNEQQVLEGHRLIMYYNDTQCDTGVGVDALYDQLYKKPTMSMLLGCSCSEVSKRVGQILPYWNVVMVSYGSTSVALTDREYYPTFFRTVTPDSSHNAARASFIEYFNWSLVAGLSQEQELFSLAQTTMSKYFETDTNITLSPVLHFVENPGPQMQKLQDADARIIIGNFQENAARAVFCEAYRRGMYGAKYVWLLVGWYSHHWWLVEDDDDDAVDCTPEELTEAVEGYFAVDSLDVNIDDRPSVSGLTSSDFQRDFHSRGIEYLSAHAAQTYDAVWTITLALKEAMARRGSIGNGSAEMTSTESEWDPMSFSYDDEDTKDTLIEIMSDVKFTGVSGPVSFNGPDRFGITTFRQNQGGEMQRVALYFPESEVLDIGSDDMVPIVWAGGFVPVDHLTVVDKPILIAKAAFLSVSVLSVLGIVLAVIFLAFNVKYRKTKYIKLSSPNLNNILVVGCMLVYTAILFMGLDGEKVSEASFAPLCTIRVSFLALGFSLAFGSMFVKTYRVYHIITHATSRVIKRKMLHESTLFLMIGVLLLLDVILIALWVIFDPMLRIEKRLPVEVSESGSVAYAPIMEECTSQHQSKWLVALYAYKGLLLLFGVFLAWETRNVKIPALNDSHYIAVCVYNVVIMSVLAVVVNNWVIQGNHRTMSFMLVSLCIFITTTATLCLLFVPKLHAIRISVSSDPVTRSVGLEVKGRTRRFVMDESTELKESIYRAEIHIRAFRREKRKLDSKIAELEGILKMLEREEQYRLGKMSEYDLDSTGREHELQMLLHLPETPIDNEESCAVNRFEHEYRRMVTGNLGAVGRRSSGYDAKSRLGSTEPRRRTSVLPFRSVASENSFHHTPLMARFSTDTDETNSDICPDLDTEKSTVLERTYGTLKGSRSGGSSDSLSSKLRTMQLRDDGGGGGGVSVGDHDACDPKEKAKEQQEEAEEDNEEEDDDDDDLVRDEEVDDEIVDNDEEDADEMTALARRWSASKCSSAGLDDPTTSEASEKEALNPDERTLITEMQDLQLRLLQLNGKANMIYYV